MFTALVAGGLTTACDVQKAVDCAQLALTVSNSADDLGNAATSNDPDAFGQAADALDRDGIEQNA